MDRVLTILEGEVIETPTKLHQAYLVLRRTKTGRKILESAGMRASDTELGEFKSFFWAGMEAEYLPVQLASYLLTNVISHSRTVLLLRQVMKELGQKTECPCVIEANAYQRPGFFKRMGNLVGLQA